MTTEATLSALRESVAEQIRSAFIREMHLYLNARGLSSNYTPGPQWDGGEGATGRMHSPVWPKLADIVLGQTMDPDLFVRAQFAGCTKPPHPNMLMSPRAVKSYRDFVKSESQSIGVGLKSQSSIFKTETVLLADRTGWSSEKCWLHILRSQDSRLTPLFRYCLAKSIKVEGSLEIRKRFKLAAMLQYLRSPDSYSKLWREWIPEKFEVAARNLHLQLQHLR